MTKQDALKEIEKNLAEVNELLKKTVAIANEHGVSFELDLPGESTGYKEPIPYCPTVQVTQKQINRHVELSDKWVTLSDEEREEYYKLDDLIDGWRGGGWQGAWQDSGC